MCLHEMPDSPGAWHGIQPCHQHADLMLMTWQQGQPSGLSSGSQMMLSRSPPHSRQSEADRNYSRAVGLYFKELSTASLDTFYERTEKSLYLAQWLLIKTESYGVVKTATHLLLLLLPLLGTAQALGPLGSHKTKPGRGRQESALSPSLLIRVGLLKTQPCIGEAFPQVLPPSRLPLWESGAAVLMLLCLPLTLGEPSTVLGTRQVEVKKPGPSCGGDAGKALASLPLSSGRSSVPLLCSLVSNDDDNSKNLSLFP